MRSLFSLIVLTIALLWSPPARAQQTDAAAAEALFQKGRDAMMEADFDAACQWFNESFALDPAVGTVMNLATCEEKRGHLASSWERWHQALALLPEDDDRVDFAQAQMTSIAQRLAHLTINVSGGEGEDLTIERDGVILGKASLGQALPTDPGKHIVTVLSPHHETRTYKIELAIGDDEELVVSPGKRKKDILSKTPGESGRTARAAAGFSALGVGVAGVATALISGLMLPAKDKQVKAHCPDLECDEDGAQALSQAKTLLAVNTVGWIAGGVGLATGGVLLLTLPSRSGSAPAGKPKEAKHAASTALNVAYTGSGLRIFGEF